MELEEALSFAQFVRTGAKNGDEGCPFWERTRISYARVDPDRIPATSRGGCHHSDRCKHELEWSEEKRRRVKNAERR